MARKFVIFIDVILLGLLAFSIPQVKFAEASAAGWSQTYGGTGEDQAYSLVQTADGGYALAGYRDPLVTLKGDFWLVKADSSGNEEWNKTYGGTNNDRAYSLVVTNDNGYALAGYTRSFGAGKNDAWLVKTDEFGNMQWNRTYGGAEDDYTYSLIRTDDGGYALAGYTKSFGAGSEDFWLIKTNSSGDMEWSKTYGGLAEDIAWSLIQTTDGGYALAGTTFFSHLQGGNNFWLVKADSSGDMQWNMTYGGENYDSALSVIQTVDGGYALAGHTESFGVGNVNFWLVKANSSGNHMWNKTYGGTTHDHQTSLIQTSDGGYALAGYTFSFGVGSGDFWLIKTDSSGNVQWNMTYGGTNADYAFSVIQTADGGYALAGATWSFGVGDGYSDFWLVKTDENGVIPEFPSAIILPLFMVITLIAAIFCRRKQKPKLKTI